MKTYLNELRGQVRGNARLRRKCDRLERRFRQLTLALMQAVYLADRYGVDVSDSASVIGWRKVSR